ncbi:nuclease-related domain-containing protein [Kineosporia sp. A_224]|uniref:nuclease-related domain-containing protein n=1 Tax=Kineosporia sp. A_224 TaxID=1962180 RepID=UPI00117AE2D9|nr:nuclease-related domain-containing protein [Kineosporia sp. A_224]
MTEQQTAGGYPPNTDDRGRQLWLRYPGRCSSCASSLPAGATVHHDAATKAMTCTACGAAGRADDGSVPVIGTAGASARRIHERRSQGRQNRIPFRASEDRRAHPCPHIDHIAVTPTGVHVIDAKRYRGRPELRVEGGLLRARSEKLVVGRRDCTKLVDGVHAQVDVVRAALADSHPGVAVDGVLCFVEAEWPLIGGDFSTRGVYVGRPKKVEKRLRAHGDCGVDTIAAIHRLLAGRLPAS